MATTLTKSQITLIDLTDPPNLVVSPNSILVPTDSDGNYTGSYTANITIYLGGSITTDWTITKTDGTGVVSALDPVLQTVTVAEGGLTQQYSYIDITASKPNFDTITMRIPVVKVIRGVDGTDGTSPVVVDLTNDNVTVATNYDGSGGTYTAATTDFSIFSGLTNVISNLTALTITPSTGVTFKYARNGVDSSNLTTTASINTSELASLSLSVIAIATAQSSGTLKIDATYSGTVYRTVFTVSKAKAGADGSPATVYEIEADKGISYDPNSTQTNKFSPASVVYSAYSTTGTNLRTPYNNSNGVIKLESSVDGSTWNQIGTNLTLSSSVSTRTLDTSTLGSTVRFVRATLLVNSVVVDQETDAITVAGVKGNTGDTGDSPVVVDLSNDNVNVATNYDGTGGNYSSANTIFTIFKGLTDVLSSVSLLTVAGSTGVTFSVSRNGVVTNNLTGTHTVATPNVTSLGLAVTAISGQDNGTLTVSATYSGTVYRTVFTVSKAKAGADGSPVTVYEIEADKGISYDPNSTQTNKFSPASVVYSAYSTTGTNLRTPYNNSNGVIKLESSVDGSTWNQIGTNLTLSSSVSTRTLDTSTLGSTVRFVRATLLVNSVVVDQETDALTVAGLKGTDAKALFVTATSNNFYLAKESTTLTPASIIITANKQNLGAGNITWTVTGGVTGTPSGTDNTIYTITNTQFGSNNSITVTATFSTYSDSITIYKYDEALDVPFVAMSNPTHELDADAIGAVYSFAGSGSTFIVKEGSTTLTYDAAATPAVSTYKFGTPTTVVDTGSITIGALSATGLADISAMTANTATITIPVIIKRANSTIVTINVAQTIVKKNRAATLNLSATKTSFKYLANNNRDTSDTATSTITLAPANIRSTSTWYYTSTKDAGSESGRTAVTAATATVSYTADDAYANMPDNYTFKVYDALSGGNLLATASIIMNATRIGDTGNSAALFRITNTGVVFVKKKDGTFAPTSIALATTYQNITGTITYQWYKNDVAISGATNSTYTVLTSDYASVSSNTYKCTITGTINGVAGSALSDSIIIPKQDEATENPSVSISDNSKIFSGPSAGYTGIDFTGGEVEITAYIGSTKCTFATSGANTFSVGTLVLSGVGGVTGSGTTNVYSLTKPSSMSTDSAYVDVPITIRGPAGTAVYSENVRITYALSRDGANGADAKTISLSATATSFIYNYDNSLNSPTGSQTVSITTSNITGTWYWTVTKNSGTESAVTASTSSTTYTYNPAGFLSMPETITIKVYDTSSKTNLLASASIAMNATRLAKDGTNGQPGENTAVVYAYKRASAAPTDNPGTVTYSFVTNTITTTLANSWSKTIPSGTDSLYIVVATAASTDTTDSILSTDWTSPVLLSTRSTINSSGLTFGIVSNTWSDYKANRVVNNVVNSASLTTDLYTSTGNSIGDTVTLSNSGYWTKVRGVYAFGVTYVPGDVVINANYTNIMISKTVNKDTAFGDPTHWVLYKGGLSISPSTWAPNTNYAVNAVVTTSTTYNTGNGADEYWVCKLSHKSSTVFANGVYQGGSPWTKTAGTYSTTTRYYPGEIVISGTTAYTCIVENINQSLTSTDYWLRYRTGLDTSNTTWSGYASYSLNRVISAVDTGNTTRLWICNYNHTASSTFSIDRDIKAFSETRYWSGTSWISSGQLIDGNLLVTGTISGDKLIAGSVTVDSLTSGSKSAVANGGSFSLGSQESVIGYRATILADQSNTGTGWALMGRVLNPNAVTAGVVGASVNPTGQTGAGGVFINATDTTFSSLRSLASLGNSDAALISRYLRDHGTINNNSITPWNQTELNTSSYSGKFAFYSSSSGYPKVSEIQLGNASYALEVTLGSSYLLNTQIQGALGVGTSDLGASGTIRATGTITQNYSDDRLKIRLGNIENALEKVALLNGFYYKPNTTAIAYGYKEEINVGLSAQEVKKILPEVVVPAPIDSKYQTIQYEKMVPLLVEAIKELQKEIVLLKERLDNGC